MKAVPTDLQGELASQAKGVVADANALTIGNSSDYEDVGEIRNRWIERAKQAEAFLRPRIQEADRHHKNLVRDLNALKSPFENAAKIAKGKMIAWDQEQERQRRLEQIRLEAEAKKKADDDAMALAEELEKAGLKNEAEQTLKEPPQVEPVAVEKTTPKVAGFSYRSNWTFEIEDESKIPREYLMPNKKKIGEIVRTLQNATKIPGIKIIEEKV